MSEAPEPRRDAALSIPAASGLAVPSALISRGLALLGAPQALMAALEALAVAIDAQDQTSANHIRRVTIYVAAVARALGMSEGEVQSVELAAILHDIGKLAVPEHILCKRGPLTAEEFQKIRAHPQVGADIIGAVPFPHPVAPLILSHHERWDGKGYPAGLKGEDIPLGARILSVADYFDALLAARPYHKAMTLEAAVGLLRQEAGKGLDPTVVETFVSMLPRLVETAAVELGPPPIAASVLEDIAAAHREVYGLYEIAQALGTALGVSDTMAALSAQLGTLVPFACAALFLYDEETETLRCRFATGTDADVVQQITVRTGEGLTGWIARNRRALVNARPSADLEAAGLDRLTTSLQSALACPLLFNERFIGTLCVYHTQPAFYRDDHRRLLDRISAQAAAVIKNSVLFEQTSEDALTDSVTGLPNARFLFMHLTRELARAERLKSHIAVLVLKLEGLTQINREHGHAVGDRALCEIARLFRTSIHPYDVCIRYEGAEFIMVLSGCSPAEAQAKRVELQRSAVTLVLESETGTRVRLRVSAGCATFPDDGDTYERLFAVADGRMTNGS